MAVRRLTFILLFFAAATAQAGQAPFGHADWRPSPTDPVGFAGQGQNWYPGATPPTEFWEGTPVEVEVAKDNKGRPVKRWSYADRKPKNILWKVPVPGWSDSLPIVVGKRVISLTSPHYVTCYDADTGTVLWQDELKACLIPVLAADRKAPEPAPDPAQAQKLQTLYELSLAYYRVAIAINAGKDRKVTDETFVPRRPLIQYVMTVLEGMKKTLGVEYPELAEALEQERAGLAAIAGGDYTNINRWSGNHTGNPNINTAFMRGLAQARERLSALKHRSWPPVFSHWPGIPSDTMAVPVSDGEIVGVTFGHGQVAAYEVAAGRRLWAWRDPLLCASSASHCQSPLLWKDLLIVPGGGRSPGAGRKRTAGPNDYTQTLIGVDKRTGAIRWESTRGPGGCFPEGSHGDHMSPCLVRLPDGKGGVRALVVGNQGAVLDAETGAVLVQLPSSVGGDRPGQWGSGFVTGVGTRLYKAFGADNFTPPADCWTLWFADGKLVAGNGFVTEVRGSAHNPFAASDKTIAIGGHLLDPATGKVQAKWPGRGAAPTLAGNRLITKEDYGASALRGRTWPDRMALAIFTVTDVTDTAQPAVLSKTPNLLGDAALPSDIADLYFPELKNPELKQWCLGCYRGMGSGFGVDISGVTCHGGRIYLKSQTHLYCIGEK